MVSITKKIYSIYHFVLAFVAALWYGFPSRDLIVIGITGTKGKTSTAELLHEILSESGQKVASSSSLRFRIGDEIVPNDLKMTMPGRFFMQRFLYRAKRAGCRHVVLEVTSQGIMQHRHRFIRFDTAVLTNVTPEHIEAHGGFENYVAAKQKLFRAVAADGAIVLNRDDAQSESFAKAARSRVKIWYGRGGINLPNRAIALSGVRDGTAGISFAARSESENTSAAVQDVEFHSPLQGTFNFLNILAAASAGLYYGISPERIAAATKRISGIAGRMEYVQREPFAVIVDYAHTPDSLRSVYETLGRDHGRLICVFGATGGGRDAWKRPEFAKIAERFCETALLTDEDPYDEDPASILDDIERGFSEKFKSRVIRMLDRKAAIQDAIRRAQPGDAVIITGKGGEPWLMGPHGTKIPWDDRQIAREALRRPKI
ncbi:MAG: UDP-N-acetylmuramoyl-L-alanyl-D-glutamate--2,6-diaminopimelate ligase [Candidatus Sungbacteria bacterium]|nr:UDP-N-acetylmuramoyl-L-alanyl-D-glutamate--2,6-diaminopimelate ligase [Candidatus Sungbacteria bacterium]